MVAGGYSYGRLHMAQSKNVEDFFAEFINKFRPARVLEIGTRDGGLTLMVRNLLDKEGLKDSIIRTYDTKEQKFLKPLVDSRTEVYTKNVFNRAYNRFKDEDSKEEIASFINQGAPSVVLCDGGSKKNEFNIIAPLLRKGDVIMAHDYAPNKEYFEEHIKGKIWNWMEIQDKDIQSTVENNNLKPYLQESAQSAVWVCKIKS